jgi:hypothetical protein
MKDSEDFADQIERDEHKELEKQYKENNDDGITDAEMFDLYGPSDDDDYQGDDY